MSNRNPRNIQLLSQISDGNPFKETLAPRFFAIGQDFDRDIEAILQDRRWSQEGKRDKVKERVQKALLELDAAQRPIDDHRRQSESLRAGIKTPSYDKADQVGALHRLKMLDRSKEMTPGQRAGLMTGPTRSVAFRDAILEFADDPWMAGINIHDPGEREIFEAAKEEQRRDLNGPLMDALAARDSTEGEIMMVANIIRNDVTSDAADLASRAA